MRSVLQRRGAGSLMGVVCSIFVATLVHGQSQIHGSKWEDVDANGAWNAGEIGLPGWKIYADLNANEQWDTGEPFAVTDLSGDYELAVTSGTYSIREEWQPAWTQTFPSTNWAGTGELTSRQLLWDGTNGVDGLSCVDSLVVSPDGQYVYVAGRLDHAVSQFTRDAITGDLTYVGIVKDGVGGVDGLEYVGSVTISPDGKHVYTASVSEDAVTVFSCDPTNGTLTCLQVIRNGFGGLYGLDVPGNPVVSPDGRHVYVRGYADDAVVVFSRNSVNGNLTWVETVQDGVGGVDGLDGVYGLNISPDGCNVYTAANQDHAVTVFSRNTTSGRLTFGQMIQNGTGGTLGMSGVSWTVVSPDGYNVYSCGSGDDALTVFSRDGTDGHLTYVEVFKDGVGGVDGLDFPACPTVSPDGRHLYVVDNSDNTVAAFSRDVSDGRLAYVGVVKDGVGGVDGLWGARALDLGPDGKHVYAGSGFDNTVVVFDRAITNWFSESHPVTVGPGQVVSNINFGNLPPARYLVLTIPATAMEGDGTVTGRVSIVPPPVSSLVLTLSSVDPAEATITNSITVPADQPSVDFDLAIIDDGRLDGTQRVEITVLAAECGSGRAVIAVSDDETAVLGLTLPSSAMEDDGILVGQGVLTVDTPPTAPFNVALSVDTPSTLSVANALTIPAGQTNVLFDLAVVDNDKIDGARTVTATAHVDGWTDGVDSMVVLDDEHTNLVVALAASAGEGDGVMAGGGAVLISGTLTNDLLVSLSSDDLTEITVASQVSIVAGSTSVTFDVVVQDDGLFDGAQTTRVSAVAAGFAGGGDDIVVHDNETRIQGRKWEDLNGDAVWDGDERVLRDWKIYVDINTNRQWDAGEPFDLTDGNGVYSIDVAAGANVVSEEHQQHWTQTFPPTNAGGPFGLSFVHAVTNGVDGVDGIDLALSLCVSPDGNHLYVAGRESDALAVFSRDSDGGGLSFVQVVKDGIGGVDGLDGVSSVDVSPDGSNVYAAGYYDDAIAVFDRDGVSGQLLFSQMIQNGVGGVDGLDGAYGVTVAPDGRQVYVAGLTDDAAVTFHRDPVSGQLSFVDVLKNGVSGISGLDGAISITVSDDGNHVYVAGYSSDAIVVCGRHPLMGYLWPIEVLRDGVGGVSGLDGAMSVVVAPGGGHVYAVGLYDDAVVAFSREATSGQLTFLEAMTNGVGGIEGLHSPWDVAVSPDGLWVYTAGRADDALAAFRRNPVSGELTFRGACRDGVDGVEGLRGVSAAAFSPNGANLYAAGSNGDAVSVFEHGSAWAGSYFVEETAGMVVTDIDFGNMPPERRLFVRLPGTVAEGAGGVTGMVTVLLPAESNLLVSLMSDDVSEATVTNMVTVLSGQTSAVFEVMVPEDGDLDGTQLVTIRATTIGYRDGVADVAVDDNEVAALSVLLPVSVSEGGGVLMGQGSIAVDMMPTSEFVISLASDDESSLLVSNSVTILTGQTNVVFDLAVVDNGRIDGARTVTVSAAVQGWISGSNSVVVLDDEHTNLVVRSVGAAMEGGGVVSNAGSVSISGTLTNDLSVGLTSDDITEVTVSNVVRIPAGLTSVVFAVTVEDDGDTDGEQTAVITASAPGFGGGTNAFRVIDDDLHHFGFAFISSPQTSRAPFQVSISAQSIDGVPLTAYSGTAGLSGTGDSGPVSVLPTNTGAFTLGWWKADVGVKGLGDNVVLSVDDGYGHTGLSAPFDVVPLPPPVPRDPVPVHSATGIPANASLSWQCGDTNISTEDVSYDVYVGTTSTPGTNEFVGSTTNTAWDPPPFEPYVTYYWQVVAERDGVRVLGPVWDFSIEGVNYFEWGPIATNQLVNDPFPALITAKDACHRTVTGFVGTVGMQVLAADEVLHADFEDGMDGFTLDNSYGIGGGLWHRTTGRGMQMVHSASNSIYYGAGEGPAGGGDYDVGNSQGTLISPIIDLNGAVPPVTLSFRYWLETEAAPGYDAGVVEISSNGGPFVVVAGNQGSGTALSDPTTGMWASVSVDLSACAGKQIRARFHFNTGDDTRNKHEGWYVDDVVVRASGLVVLPFVRTLPSSFVSGVWTGEVQVLTTASDVLMRADDGAGHTVDSGLFDVGCLGKLRLLLPSGTAEGDGVLTNEGVVTISVALSNKLDVALFSADGTEVQVPGLVTIPAGQTSAVFDVFIQDDTDTDGVQTAGVFASAAGFERVDSAINVADNDVHSFMFSHVVSPQTQLVPFGLVISALDTNGLPASGYDGMASIAAADIGGPVGVRPVVVGPFTSGGWTGKLAVVEIGTNVVLTASDGMGHDGESNPFNVLASPMFAPQPRHGATDVRLATVLRWSYDPRFTGGAELIGNGDFEAGDFTKWLQRTTGGGSFVINDGTYDPYGLDGPRPPFAGAFSALADQAAPGTRTLYQDVEIPTNAVSALLAWNDCIRNHAAAFVDPNQEFRVEITDTNDVLLTQVYSTNSGDPLTNAWTRRLFSVVPLAGQRVRVKFSEQDELGHLNVHLDDVSLTVSTSTVDVVYSVYFGTSSTPGTNEFQGSTSNMTWSLPALKHQSTYYWRVVAECGGVCITGPVWEFTTEGVDQFEWGAVGAQQLMNDPFPVMITARDSGNVIVTGFVGTVQLSGRGTDRPLDASFEPPPIPFVVDNTYGTGDGLWHRTTGRAVDSGHTASNSFYYGQGEGPAGGGDYDAGDTEGVITSIPVNLTNAVAPVDLSFNYLLATEGAVGYDSATVEVSSNGGAFQVVAGNQGAGVALVDAASGTWTNVGVDLSSYTGTQIRVRFRFRTGDSTRNDREGWYIDDVLVTAAGAASVQVCPGLSGNFVSGVWTGSVRMLGGGTDVWLHADDGAGHSGNSLPFDVGTFTALGTPVTWLFRHGLTNGRPCFVEQQDCDNDGMLTWREYIADTDPSSTESVLAITGLSITGGTVRVEWKGGKQACQYLERRTYLGSTSGQWTAVFTNGPGTTVTNLYDDSSAGSSIRFYRIRVERP